MSQLSKYSVEFRDGSSAVAEGFSRACDLVSERLGERLVIGNCCAGVWPIYQDGVRVASLRKKDIIQSQFNYDDNSFGV